MSNFSYLNHICGTEVPSLLGINSSFCLCPIDVFLSSHCTPLYVITGNYCGFAFHIFVLCKEHISQCSSMALLFVFIISRWQCLRSRHILCEAAATQTTLVCWIKSLFVLASLGDLFKTKCCHCYTIINGNTNSCAFALGYFDEIVVLCWLQKVDINDIICILWLTGFVSMQMERSQRAGCNRKVVPSYNPYTATL